MLAMIIRHQSRIRTTYYGGEDLQPTSKSERRIPLLHLLPAADENELQYYYSLASINKDLHIETLSYVWSDEN
jgi:hypothetical protein